MDEQVMQNTREKQGVATSFGSILYFVVRVERHAGNSELEFFSTYGSQTGCHSPVTTSHSQRGEEARQSHTRNPDSPL